VFVRLNELWRVGYHEDPLCVSIEYQGNGRFDDPQRERTVLYGSDTIETCIIESALPWSLHPDASYVQRTEAPERDADSELQQAELDDAERDRVIAMKPAQMPADLYDKAKVYVALAEPIVVLDLDDISVRRDLAQIPEIAAKMRERDLPDLDLTRTISGHLMRRPFGGHDFADAVMPTSGVESSVAYGTCSWKRQARSSAGKTLSGHATGSSTATTAVNKRETRRKPNAASEPEPSNAPARKSTSTAVTMPAAEDL
jgi:hypothetical protein